MTDRQDQITICPVCERETSLTIWHCEHCGAPLKHGIVTVQLSDQDTPNTSAELQQPYMKDTLSAGSLALLVLGQGDPIVIKDHQEIILGRQVKGEPPPTVDLSEYHGHLLGVSRRHAVIHHTADQITLEDLNSHNGTWINNQRIPANHAQPIQNGDQIRLGQLVLYVYFA